MALGPTADAFARRAYVKPAPAAHQCKDVRSLVLDLAAQQAVNAFYGYDWYYMRGGVVDAEASTQKSGEGGAPGHHTGTNNQEQGVDEADFVKSNGRYIFTIKDREVIITRAYPVKSMKVVARIKLSEHATPSQLQLYKNRLVVLSSVWEPGKKLEQATDGHADAIGHGRIWRRPPARFSGTRISVYDIAVPHRPRLRAETDIEGWLARARNVGDDIYLVTNAQMRVPDAIARVAKMRVNMLPKLADKKRYDWKAIEAARKAALPIVKNYLAKRFARVSMSSAMPRTRRRIGNRMSALVPMYSCRQLAVPGNQSPNQTGLLQVTHLDLDAPAALSTAAIVGSGWQIYTSQSSMYVTMANYGWNGQTPGTSQVHKFLLRSYGNDRPRYQASGNVPGHLLNQFSMSEHNGFLRVMTTDQQWGPQGRIDTAANNLFVMATRGRKLQVVGAVRGLAEGERIFSARMFGDKGYMVTFRQTDPLFTFDLSDPYEPRMVGELKINGFSSYIHPLDGDRLLTIGRDADDEGRIKGLHLQIFDVSNPAKPIRTHQRLLSGGRWAHSAAQYNHHAFTYDAVTKTLAIPVSSYNYNDRRSYSGLEVFDISRRGIRYRGAVTHEQLETKSSDSWQSSWEKTIQRSMIIGDALVSVSRAGIVASKAKRPSWTVGSASFYKKPKPLGRWAVPHRGLVRYFFK